MILKDMKDFKYAGNDIQKIMYKENILWQRSGSGFSDIKELYNVTSGCIPAVTLIGTDIYIVVSVPNIAREYKMYKLDTTNDQLTFIDDLLTPNIGYDTILYSVSHNGIMYLEVPGNSSELFPYNNSKWSSIIIPDKYANVNNGICVFNGNIHFFNNNNHILYNIESNNFKISEVTPINFFMENPIVYNNKIHVFGGDRDSSIHEQFRYHYTWDGFGWKFIGEFTKPMDNAIYGGNTPFWSFEPTPVIFKNELYIIDECIKYGHVTKYTGQKNKMYELVDVNDKDGIFNSSIGRKAVVSTGDAIYIIGKNTNGGDNVNIVKMK